MKPKFTPGKNIAMKVPTNEFDGTVAFYRDILGFEEVNLNSPDNLESVTFKFGDKISGLIRSPVLARQKYGLKSLQKTLRWHRSILRKITISDEMELSHCRKGLKGFGLLIQQTLYI